MTENEIGKIVVDVAINVHKGLGPGLLESVYETVLACQLSKTGGAGEPSSACAHCFLR